jgi:hypothetical protein
VVHTQQPKALIAREGYHDPHLCAQNSYATGDNTGNYAVDEYVDVVDIWDLVM